MKKLISFMLVFILAFLFITPASASGNKEFKDDYDQMEAIIGKEKIIASLTFEELDAATTEYINNLGIDIDTDSIGIISYIKTDDENTLDINVTALLDDDTYVSVTAHQLSEREDGSLFHSTNQDLFSSFKENLRANPLYGYVYPAGITLYAYIHFQKHSLYNSLIRPYRGSFRFTYNNSTPNFFVRNFSMYYYAVGELWTVSGNAATTNHDLKTWQVSQYQNIVSPGLTYYSDFSYLVSNQYIEISANNSCGSGCYYTFEKVLNADASYTIHQGYIDLGQNVS